MPPGYSTADELIRFRCEACGKLLGADPAMDVVVCSQCKLENEVPSPKVLLDSQSQPVRIVAIDLPWKLTLYLGLKVAVAAIPLILLLALAAYVVICLATMET